MFRTIFFDFRKKRLHFLRAAVIMKQVADVAQLVEQLIRNQQVEGSSPSIS